MGFNDMFVYSDYSIKDLESFRDEDGFIDLSKAGIKFTEESREIIGNPNRVKNWVDFNGKKVLIKGEAILNDEKNYGIYGELITEEIAKKLGVETAHYDLVKMTNEEGNVIFGVLSETIVDIENGERMESLHSIIGDEPEEENQFIDTTTYEFVIKKLREQLILDGIDEEQVEKVIIDLKKRLVFGIGVVDTDKHTENVAFIRKKVDGKETIKLSPNFDSESALMLDTDLSTIDKLLADSHALKESVSFADPRIGILVSKNEGGFDSLWMDTLEALCEDDEIYDYCYEILSEPIDMDEILKNVENRIGAELPMQVKLLAKYTYQFRNEEMQKVIQGEEIQQGKQDRIDLDLLLKNLISRGKDIRMGELLSMGESMEYDMQEERDDYDEVLILDEDEEFIEEFDD